MPGRPCGRTCHGSGGCWSRSQSAEFPQGCCPPRQAGTCCRSIPARSTCTCSAGWPAPSAPPPQAGQWRRYLQRWRCGGGRRWAATPALGAGRALWRGQPLAGIDWEWACRMREAWGRERVDATVAWARAELAHGNPRPVLAALPELASDNPLVESLTEVLMRTLHAVGRTSEALDLYTRTRTQLAEELGTDPGPELQALHQSLLRGEVQTAPPAASSRPVPRQLPAPPRLFTGRSGELAALSGMLDEAGAQ